MSELIYRPDDPVGDFLFHWSPPVAAILACLFGLVLLMLGFRNLVTAERLRRYGQRGRAVITRKWLKKGYVAQEERHSVRATKDHFLQLERQEGGRSFSTAEISPAELWSEVEVGDEVEVIYLDGSAKMRLAVWPEGMWQGAGGIQLWVGALLVAFPVGYMANGILRALSDPPYSTMERYWSQGHAEVLQVGAPSDPFMRILAPDKTYLHVAFGDTDGGREMSNTRTILVTRDQLRGDLPEVGALLPAWISPENRFNAVLDLERDPDLR